MIRLLSLLFVGDWHRHHWTILHEIRVFDDYSGGLPVARHYHLQCQHCGNVKAKKL